MKKYLFLMLLLFIGVFVTTAFTSCSSDDDDSKVQDLSIVGTWKDQSRTRMLYGPSTKMEKAIVKRKRQRYPIKLLSHLPLMVIHWQFLQKAMGRHITKLIKLSLTKLI